MSRLYLDQGLSKSVLRHLGPDNSFLQRAALCSTAHLAVSWPPLPSGCHTPYPSCDNKQSQTLPTNPWVEITTSSEALGGVPVTAWAERRVLFRTAASPTGTTGQQLFFTNLLHKY